MNAGSRRTVLVIRSRYGIRGGEDVQTDRAVAALHAAGWLTHTLEAEPPASALETAVRIGESGGAAWSRHWARRVRVSALEVRPVVAFVQNTFPWMTGSVIDALTALGIPTIVGLHNFRIVCPAGSLVREGERCTDCVSLGPESAWGNRCYRNSVIGSWMAARSSGSFRSVLERRSQNVVISAPSRFAALTLTELVPSVGPVEILPNIVPSAAFDADHQPVPGQLLVASRLSVEKGLREVLRGFSSFARERKHTLIVAGDGPLRASLQEEASTLAADIRFAGQVDDRQLHDLIRTSIGVLCSSRAPETFGMTTAEAACAGVPLIVSDAGALVETAGGEGAAIVVSDGSEASWALALEHLVTDPAGAAMRAAIAQRHARSHFGDAAYVARFDELVALSTNLTGV